MGKVLLFGLVCGAVCAIGLPVEAKLQPQAVREIQTIACETYRTGNRGYIEIREEVRGMVQQNYILEQYEEALLGMATPVRNYNVDPGLKAQAQYSSFKNIQEHTDAIMDVIVPSCQPRTFSLVVKTELLSSIDEVIQKRACDAYRSGKYSYGQIRLATSELTRKSHVPEKEELEVLNFVKNSNIQDLRMKAAISYYRYQTIQKRTNTILNSVVSNCQPTR